MNYIDEEEREGRFTKKRIILLVILLLVFAIAIVGVFLLFEKRSEQKNDKEVRVENPSEEEGKVAEPFILDDVKEELPKVKPLALPTFPNKTLVEKHLADEEGDRICEYQEIKLPEILEAGNTIDVRLSLGDGRDYTVLKKKKVGDFFRKDEKEIVWLSLSNSEIIFMESALSDLNLFKRAKLYAIIHENDNSAVIQVNYPFNYKSEKLLEKLYAKNLPKDIRKLKDEELNEDRRRLIELGVENTSKWKEAAAYWDSE